MNPDLFICHSSKDKEFADQLVIKLEESSIQCWIAPRNIQAGKKWAGEIMRALDHSKTLLFILSKSSNESDQVLTELETAKDGKIPIIPIIVEDVDLSYDVKYFIRSHQWIDAKNSSADKVVREVLNSLEGHGILVEHPGSGVEAGTIEQSPEQSDIQTTDTTELITEQAPIEPEAGSEFFRNPYILVHHSTEKLSSFENIPVIDEISGSGRALIIISTEFEGEAAVYLKPKMFKGVLVTALNAPEFGERRKEILKDIATITGATFISEDIGFMLEYTDTSSLGEAELITINHQLDEEKQASFGDLSYYYSSPINMIRQGNGDPQDIKERLEQLELEKEMTPSDYDREKLQIRINNFSVEGKAYLFKYSAEE